MIADPAPCEPAFTAAEPVIYRPHKTELELNDLTLSGPPLTLTLAGLTPIGGDKNYSRGPPHQMSLKGMKRGLC